MTTFCIAFYESYLSTLSTLDRDWIHAKLRDQNTGKKSSNFKNLTKYQLTRRNLIQPFAPMTRQHYYSAQKKLCNIHFISYSIVQAKPVSTTAINGCQVKIPQMLHFADSRWQIGDNKTFSRISTRFFPKIDNIFPYCKCLFIFGGTCIGSFWSFAKMIQIIGEQCQNKN